MTDWDITGLVHNIDHEDLARSISEQPIAELIATYKALTCVTNVLLRFANIPAVAYPLSELSYAYGLEMVNRYLNPPTGTRIVDIPSECIPENFV